MKWITIIALLLVLTGCKKSSDRIEVVNRGVSGNTSFDLAARLNSDVLSENAQLVIIMIGTNDAAKKVTYSEYEANLTLIINKIKTSGADVLLLSPPPRGTDTTTNTFLNNRTTALTVICDTLSKRLNCHYIDINKAFKDAGSPNPTAGSMLFNAANYPLQPDGVHPTGNGLAFITTQVYNFMQANMPVANYKKIICFGDSITSGYRGSGKNYPERLEDMLNN